ncbi:MAG: RNA polymerase sigma factor [Streptosporangiaceae bacterium]
MGRTPPGPSDADLVRDALAGQRTALAELLLRHWETAMFLAGRVLGSADLGRDAAQEAAIAAMTDLTRLRSPDRFGAWFCGIALNVARRWLRQLRREVPGMPAGASELAAPAPGPDEAAELADLAARVRAAIGGLAAGQRAPCCCSTSRASATPRWRRNSASPPGPSRPGCTRAGPRSRHGSRRSPISERTNT